MTIPEAKRAAGIMAPVLGILPERAEQNKDFEVGDLLPWSEK